MNDDSVVRQLNVTGHLDRIYVDGEWVLPAGQDSATVIDPSTEQPVAQIALGNAQDVAAAVDAARRAVATWSVRRLKAGPISWAACTA